MKKIAMWFCVCSLLGACSGTREVAARDAKFQLYVDVEPPQAVILIDDAVVARGRHTVERPLVVDAGTRRITIVCDGYYPFKTTLEYMQPGEVYTLRTHLIRHDF